jgi:hypothetical protein
MTRDPEAYRGPWAGYDEFGEGIILLFDFPLRALVFCIPSLLFKPNIRAAVVLGLSLLFGVLVFSMIGLVED